MKRYNLLHTTVKTPNIAIVYKSQDFSEDSYDCFHFQELSKITNCSNIDYSNIYRKLGRDGFLKYLNDYIKTNSINVLLFLTTYWLEFDVEILKHLRKKVYIVYWMFDDATLFDTFTKYYGQLADLVITEDYHATLKYAQMGIDSIAYFSSYDINKYKVLNLEKSIDVSMVGRMDKDNRKELVGYLLKNGINVETYGAGTKHGFIELEDMIRVFNSSKINVNTSGIKTDLLTELEPAVHKNKQIKGRITEIALTKSFVLSEYAPGIEQVYELGKEIEVFHDKEELVQKVRYYLSHEEERKAIALRGYERARRDYDKDVSIPRVVKEIHKRYETVNWDKRQKEKLEVYFNDSFKKIYSNFRFRHLLFFLKQRRFACAIQEFRTFLVYRKFDYRICSYYVGGIRSWLNPYSLIRKIRGFIKN